MRIGIATITSTALVGGTLVAVPAHPLLPITAVAQAQEVQQQQEVTSSALAQVLDLSLFSESLSVVNGVSAAQQTDADTITNATGNQANLDLGLLNDAIVIELENGLTVPLIDPNGNGILTGEAGVLGAYAHAPNPASAQAVVGAVGADGTVALDNTPTGVGNPLELDLTNILGVDLPAEVIDELSLSLGAIGASASKEGANAPELDYELADLKLTLDAPVLEGVIGSVNGLVGGLEETVNGALPGSDALQSGLSGFLATIASGLIGVDLNLGVQLGVMDLLNPILNEPLADDSGLASINLAAGTIEVNLEAIHPGGLNDLDPNTPLLDEDAITKITDTVTNLLTDSSNPNSLISKVQQVLTGDSETKTGGLYGTTVELSLELGNTGLLGLLGTILTPLGLGDLLNGLVGGIDFETSLGGLLDPDILATNDRAVYEADPYNYVLISGQGVVGGLLATVLGAVKGVLSIAGGAVEGLLFNQDGLLQGVTGGLGEILGGVVGPLGTALNGENGLLTPLAGIIINKQSVEDGVHSVTALDINLLNGTVQLPLAKASVSALDEWQDVVAPTIADIADQTVTVGDDIAPVTPVVTPDDATVTAAGLPAGVTLDNGVISGAPTQVGTFEVTVTATNSADSASTTFNIVVNPEDVVIPTIADIADQTVTVGEAIDPITPAATPDDAEIEVIGLPAGVTFTNGVISGVPTAEGTTVVTVTATSGGESASTTFSITANAVEEDAPSVDNIADQTITLGDSITDITPVVTPADADVTVIGLPAGVTFDNGVISGTPTAVGSATVTVRATNTAGTDTARFTITTNPVAGPAAPTLDTIADQIVTVGEAIDPVTPSFTPDDAEVEVIGLPAGVTFTNGVISGAPTAEGTTVVTVTVTSGTGFASTTFSITANAVEEDAPSVDSIADQTITLGDAIADVTPVVTPADADVTVIGLPAGVTFDNGVISGTPTGVGSATVTVRATNTAGTDTVRFTIITNPADSNVPVITPIDDQDGVVGEEIDDIPVIVTPEESEVEVEGLPEGIEYDPETGIIGGTPAEGTDGSHTIIVTATNDGETSTETFVLVIREAGTTLPPVSGGSENGSSEFLQQCLDSPAAGVAGLLVVLGAIGAIGGPALEPMFKAVGGELDRQLRMLVNATSGAHQPQWVRNINKGLNDAANAVDHRMVTNALFATAALALATSPILCGMDNNSSSGSSSSS
ncbi:hypothetical protein KbCgl_26760 [Corynebacterium glutamicum]|nr:hypothetical protein KbCgl_26760 [Corynebacterium glutamicum]